MNKVVELEANSVIDTHAVVGRMQRIEEQAAATSTGEQDAQAYSNYLRRVHNIPENQTSVLLNTNLGSCIVFGEDAAVRAVVSVVSAAAASAAA